MPEIAKKWDGDEANDFRINIKTYYRNILLIPKEMEHCFSEGNYDDIESRIESGDIFTLQLYFERGNYASFEFHFKRNDKVLMEIDYEDKVWLSDLVNYMQDAVPELKNNAECSWENAKDIFQKSLFAISKL